MKIYSLPELLDFVRAHSAYYQGLYEGVAKAPKLADLPMVEQEAFWHAAHDGKLFTGSMQDGIVFKSGGSTGNPKFSLFSAEEWQTFIEVFGAGMARGGVVRHGDRVGNVFYVGELYASFLFIMGSLQNSSVRIIQYPIGGATPLDQIAKAIKEFSINVIAGVPSSMMQLAAFVAQEHIALPSLERFIYGGEPLHADQQVYLQNVWPQLKTHSIGWASVDGGLLGYYTPDCQPGEHRVFSDATVIEIVDDESGRVIEEEGVVGKVLLTNLTRRLMPILRYPVGDLAMWTEPRGVKDRRLRLQGRSQEGARVGPATVYLEDFRRVLHTFALELSQVGFQVITEHHGERDQLILRIGVATVPQSLECLNRILAAIYSERPMLKDIIEKELIHPIKIEIVAAADLEYNPRTGKLRTLIDRRFLP